LATFMSSYRRLCGVDPSVRRGRRHRTRSADLLWESLTEPIRQTIITCLDRGAATGQLHAAIRSFAAADSILGSLLFTVITRADVPASYADDLVDVILHGRIDPPRPP